MEIKKLKEAAKLIDIELGLEIPGLEAGASATYKDVVRLKAAAREAEQLLLRESRVVEQKRSRKNAAAALAKVIDLDLLDVLLGNRKPTDKEIKTLVKHGLVDDDWDSWRLTSKAGQVVALCQELTRD